MTTQQTYGDLLNTAVTKVLETMSFLDAVPGEPIQEECVLTELNLSATVCIAGEISGLLAVHCSRDFAAQCYELISGGGDPCEDTQVCDTVGELANMIAGTLKREMSAVVDLFFISLPSITLSDNQRLYFTGAKTDFPRLLVPYRIDEENIFYVELLFHKR